MIERILSEKSAWEKLAESPRPIVLYGMGNGADMVLDECCRLNIPVAGVFASDDFVRGQSFRGFRVKKLAELERELGEVTVAVCFASSLDDVMNHIVAVSRRHPLLVPSVPVTGKDLFNRTFAENHREKLDAAFDLLADEESRRVLEGCARAMFGGELSDIMATACPKETVFESFFKLGEGEHYLDLGAYRGDTVEEFLRFTGGKYETITALEPDGKSFAKLETGLAQIPRAAAIHGCAYDRDGEIPFQNAAGRQSAIGKSGKAVPCFTVDSLAKKDAPTYIKADIEGAEKEMLRGAAATLASCKPKLSISAYHRSEDIFEIPLLIHSLNPSYKIYLRRHPYIPCWESIFYCL